MLNKLFKGKKKDKDSIDLDFLRGIPLCYRLRTRELEQLSDFFIQKEFKKDEIIFREDFPQVVMYIVKSGRVKLFQDKPEYELLVAEIMPQMMFGQLGFFLDVNRSVTAIAVEDTVLIALNKSDLVNFVKGHSGTGIKLLTNLGRSVTSDLMREIEILKEYESKK